MKLNKELLEDLTNDVLYPIEELVEKELQQRNPKEKDAISFLKKIGFFKIPLIYFGFNVDIEKLKQKLGEIDSEYARELIDYLCDSLKEFIQKRELEETDAYEKFCEHFAYLKNTQDENDEFFDDDEFFDFSDEQDSELDHMHYKESEKISASAYMQSADIDPDLIRDIKDLLEQYKEVKFRYDTFCDEAKMEVEKIFMHFDTIFKLSIDYKDIATSMDHLIFVLKTLKIENLDNSQKDMLKLFFDSIVDDLEKWYQEVIVQQSANDIHYLDASLLSSIVQIQLFFNQDDNKQER